MLSPTYKLIIEKPCQEEWNSMAPVNGGRFCNSCEKTVTDFSTLSDEAIRAFFLENSSRPVCGRFYVSQLSRITIYLSPSLLKNRIPFWKKFLVIFLVCFGSNIYPFDTIIGSKPDLYAQSTTSKFKKKKNNSKRLRYRFKKKWKIESIKFTMPTDWVVSGYTQCVPVEPGILLQGEHVVEPDSFLHPQKNAISNSMQKSETGNEKKIPDEDSEKSTVFILPEAMRFRKRK